MILAVPVFLPSAANYSRRVPRQKSGREEKPKKSCEKKNLRRNLFFRALALALVLSNHTGNSGRTADQSKYRRMAAMVICSRADPSYSMSRCLWGNSTGAVPGKQPLPHFWYLLFDCRNSKRFSICFFYQRPGFQFLDHHFPSARGGDSTCWRILRIPGSCRNSYSCRSCFIRKMEKSLEMVYCHVP